MTTNVYQMNHRAQPSFAQQRSGFHGVFLSLPHGYKELGLRRNGHDLANGQFFPSSLAASLAMGYNCDAIGKAFHRAKQKNPGAYAVTVDCITFLFAAESFRRGVPMVKRFFIEKPAEWPPAAGIPLSDFEAKLTAEQASASEAYEAEHGCPSPHPIVLEGSSPTASMTPAELPRSPDETQSICRSTSAIHLADSASDNVVSPAQSATTTSRFELVAVPEALLQIGDRPVYWLRNEYGSYEAMPPRDFSFKAKLRGGARKLRELRAETVTRRVVVRCVAGLRPGLYKDGKTVFLNPDFVPLTSIPEGPDPTHEFHKLFEQLAALMDADQSNPMVPKLREQLLQMYLADRKVRAADGRARFWHSLTAGSDSRQFPRADHCQLFEGEQGFIWTSQPYGSISEGDAAEILGFARQYGLQVSVSPKWSWYYPGRTTLIEWRRDPNARPLVDF